MIYSSLALLLALAEAAEAKPMDTMPEARAEAPAAKPAPEPEFKQAVDLTKEEAEMAKPAASESAPAEPEKAKEEVHKGPPAEPKPAKTGVEIAEDEAHKGPPAKPKPAKSGIEIAEDEAHKGPPAKPKPAKSGIEIAEDEAHKGPPAKPKHPKSGIEIAKPAETAPAETTPATGLVAPGQPIPPAPLRNVAITPVIPPAPPSNEAKAIDFATKHCQSWLQQNPEGGVPTMNFILGKAISKASKDQQQQFGRLFADHLLNKYDVDPKTSSCVFEIMDVRESGGGEVEVGGERRYKVQRKAEEHAYVRTMLKSKTPGVPVAMVYHLIASPDSNWLIDNISINGQPLVQNYQEKYQAKLEKGRFDDLLESLRAK